MSAEIAPLPSNKALGKLNKKGKLEFKYVIAVLTNQPAA